MKLRIGSGTQIWKKKVWMVDGIGYRKTGHNKLRSQTHNVDKLEKQIES